MDPLTHRRLGISDSLLDAVKGITEKKKLDPVGKADADIDNANLSPDEEFAPHSRLRSASNRNKNQNNGGSVLAPVSTRLTRSMSRSHTPLSQIANPNTNNLKMTDRSKNDAANLRFRY